MAKYFNISGDLTKELLAPGDNHSASSISFTNINDVPVKLDLYIEKKFEGKFFILKNHVFSGNFIYGNLNFKNSANEFGLFMKLTAIGSITPSVDVIMS